MAELGLDSSQLDDSTRLWLARSVSQTDEDPTLQDICRRASAATGFPIVLISIVLQRRQFFRAHVGLPQDLSISRPTDRCVSFCQFVVSSGEELEVTRTRDTPGLPLELVERYNVQAYFGVPVRLGGYVLGTLCLLDITPHPLTEAQKKTVRDLGKEVERVIQQVSSDQQKRGSTIQAATVGAFQELRNELQILGLLSHRLAGEASDLSVLSSTVRAIVDERISPAEGLRALSVLREVSHAALDQAATIAELSQVTIRLNETCNALQEALSPEPSVVSLGEAVARAMRLAHHATKVAGGVRCRQPETMLLAQAPTTGLGSLLATLLLGLSELAAPSAGIDVIISQQAGNALLRFTVPGKKASDMRPLLQDLASLYVAELPLAVEDNGIVMRLRLAS